LQSGFAVIALISGLLTAVIAIALKRGTTLKPRVPASLGLATLPIGLLLIVAGRASEGARGERIAQDREATVATGV